MKKMILISKYKSRLIQVAVLLAALVLLCDIADRLPVIEAEKKNNEGAFSVSELDVQSENSYDQAEDLRLQIMELIEDCSDEMDMSRRQLSMIFELADAAPVYDSEKPDILREETSVSAAAPLTISAASTEWKKADFIYCPDPSVKRPSERYLPDALYSIASDLKDLTNERHELNTQSDNLYYNSLNDEVQNTIDFDEAVLIYIGEPESHIDTFKDIYEKILTDKDANENVVEIQDEKPVIRTKFRNILREASISKPSSLKALGILFSHDQSLFKNDNIDKLTDAYVYPYEIGLTTRENMMIAAMSLVGDVRYVWGGGHSGAAFIKGINPVWKQFKNLYPSEPFSIAVSQNGKVSQNNPEYNEGFGTCIKPSGSWCPIHGYVNTAFHGETIYSLDEYIDLRSDLFEKINLKDKKYRDMLSTVNYSNGVNAHIIDGLDCSGYVSWLYNQIQNEFNVNTAARYFTQQSCFSPLSIGDDLLPGDIFSWESHIVVIVGRVSEDANAYVTLEETPNVLRFGVAYYNEATQEEINYGRQIAAEANELIGGLNAEYERPHIYCINTVGLSASANETVSEDSDDEEDPKESEESTDSEAAVYDNEDSGVRLLSAVRSKSSSKLKISDEPYVSLAEESGEQSSEGYSKEYDTILDGKAYKLVLVFMPRGYSGTAQDLGAPEEGDYESVTIDEKEEGFYGRYYVRLSEEDTVDEDGNVIAGHSADEKIDGYKVRHIFMPRDYEGSKEALGVPDESEIEKEDVIEEDDGFYATYYLKKKSKDKNKDNDEDEEEDEEEDDDIEYDEDGVLRLARYAFPFEDEGVELDDTGEAIEDMDAVDIIRHTLKKLPISMINGYNTYDGKLFSTFSFSE